MAANSDSQVVKDVGKWEWADLLKKEDWKEMLSSLIQKELSPLGE